MKCKYYKQQKQVSYDSGLTWQSLNEFRMGSLYESASTACESGVTTYKWVNTSGTTCSGTTLYRQTQRYQSTDGGQTWTAVVPSEYGLGEVIEYNSDLCGASTPQYRWYTLPNTQYICSSTTKYTKEIYQVSYDSGNSWTNVTPEQTRIGSTVIEYNSVDCGYIGTMYRWDVVGGYICSGTTKYENEQRFQSTDGGQTWTAVSPSEYRVGNVIESDSSDCSGSTPSESGYTIYEFRMTSGYVCSGTTKLEKTQKYQSTDGGQTWTAVVPTVSGVGRVIEACAADCGCSEPAEGWKLRVTYCNGETETFYTCTPQNTALGKPSYSPSAAFSCDYGYSAEGVVSAVIGDCVTSLEGGVFYGCTNLTSVTIPNSVTKFVYDGSQGATFAHCYSLTSITLPSGLTAITSDAFVYCSGLTTINIPNKVKTIGNGAFEYCSGLTSVTIGTAITSIGNSAFWHCDNLEEVYIYATTPPSLGTNAFYSTSPNLKVYVPYDSFYDYANTSGFSSLNSRGKLYPM